MKVLFLPEVRYYLRELEDVLYNKGYFSFAWQSIEYVRDLVLDIESNICKRPCHRAPRYFDRYGRGMSYAMFRKSKATQWYVFFTKYDNHGEITYLVRYITNNHVASQYLPS